MADALKGEGNKAFTEKKFDEAMCVTRASSVKGVLANLMQ